ncbi:MAG: amidase domain-containing protein [Peptococcaceae bacterium]|nr:amidase domain-containing protein [Peptococcaceae bacterium]
MIKLASRIFRRTNWYVTSGFGYRKVNNVLEFHNGTDYGTHKQNWELYAIEPGTVISCGTAGDGAKYIWVNYPRLGKKLLHYHLDHIEVEAGDEVQEGTLLGNAGETGSANGIHLHLGMQPSAANIYEDPHAYDYYYANATMNTDATVYGGPSTTLYAPIGSVFKKGQIQVINKENNFFFIRYWTDKIKLKRGYVDISQVTIDPLISIVDVTKTFKGNNNLVYPQSTLYADTNIATAATIGTILELEGVTEFTPSENNMHFIENGTPEGIKRGYIQGSELIRKEGGLAIAIASSGTNVYYTPSLEHKSGTVGANEYIALHHTGSTVSYIECNTKNGRARGYVSNSSLQLLDTDNVPALPDYTEESCTPAGFLTVYFGPTEKYAVVGSVNQGAVVTRLSSPILNTGDYSFIQYSTMEGTKRGYVFASGLVPVDPVKKVIGMHFERYSKSLEVLEMQDMSDIIANTPEMELIKTITDIRVYGYSLVGLKRLNNKTSTNYHSIEMKDDRAIVSFDTISEFNYSTNLEGASRIQNSFKTSLVNNGGWKIEKMEVDGDDLYDGLVFRLEQGEKFGIEQIKAIGEQWKQNVKDGHNQSLSLRNASNIMTPDNGTEGSMNIRSITVDYEPSNAVKYAKEYAMKRHPDFYKVTKDDGQYGNNCTNFVSQCLWAGYGGWVPDNAAQTRTNITRMFRMVYENGTGWFAGSGGGSASWENAEHLWDYLYKHNKAYGPKGTAYNNNYPYFGLVPGNLTTGNIIQLRTDPDKPETYTHSAIIVEKKGNDDFSQIYLAQNTNDDPSRNMWELIVDYGGNECFVRYVTPIPSTFDS